MKRLDLLSMLCILIGLLPFVVGRTPRDTNASRFARGLPPVRPDRLYNATRTGPSLARRSGLPSTFLLGVYMDAQTAPYCYVGAYAGDPAVSCVSAEDALLFTSSQPEGSSIPASLTVVSPGSSNGKLLTAEADTPDQGSDTTYPVTVFTTENVQSLGPNAQPGSAPSLSGWSVDPVYYETDVYYISSDGTLSVVWTDPTGSADPTTPLILWLWDGDYEVPTYIYGSYDLAATRRAGWEPIRVTIKAICSGTSQAFTISIPSIRNISSLSCLLARKLCPAYTSFVDHDGQCARIISSRSMMLQWPGRSAC